MSRVTRMPALYAAVMDAYSTQMKAVGVLSRHVFVCTHLQSEVFK